MQRLPFRAEVTDLTAAVLDGCDAIMLGAQTASGRNPVAVLNKAFKICQEAEIGFDSQEHFAKIQVAAWCLPFLSWDRNRKPVYSIQPYLNVNSTCKNPRSRLPSHWAGSRGSDLRRMLLVWLQNLHFESKSKTNQDLVMSQSEQDNMWRYVHNYSSALWVAHELARWFAGGIEQQQWDGVCSIG